MNDELLQMFGPSTGKKLLVSETIPVIVKGYILPPSGVAETPENSRLLGVRWDTGEKIEVALRRLEHGDRPKLAQFHDDSDSSTPVTTEIGGTVMVERAYADPSLKPLNDKMPVTVYNGRWINRVCQNKDQGWAVRCLARVNEPRLIDANNPASGKMQTITLMCNEDAVQISSIDQLDRAVLDALDTELRNQKPDWFKRPGAVNAIVRLSNANESNIIELSAGFHTPAGAEFSEPKPRSLVQQDLASSNFWNAKRELLAKALQSPQYKIEVVPCSTIFVGRKTLQKSLQTEKSSIKGMSRTELDGKETKLFTDTVIGLRRSPKSGQPQALFVSPITNSQIATLTGTPSTKELEDFEKQTGQSQQQSQITKPQENAANQSSVAPTEDMVFQSEALTLPIRVTQGASNPSYIVAYANNDAQDSTLREVAVSTNAQYSPAHKAIKMLAENLPVLIKAAKQHNHAVNVELGKNMGHSPANQAAPTQDTSAGVNQIPSIQTMAAPPSAPQNNDTFDLSQLDLSQIDLDSMLDDAYQQNSTGPSRSR